MNRKNTEGIMRRDYCDNGGKSENSGQILRMESKCFRKKGTVQLIVTAFVVSMIVLSSLSCLYDLWPWEGGLGQPCYADKTCDSPYVCMDGQCVEAISCSTNNCEGCCDGDICRTGTSDDACGTDGAQCIFCDEDSICVKGLCEPSCESQEEFCTEEGYEECLEDMKGYRICGYYSEEYPECLVWGETELCEEDKVCIDGECVICGDEDEPCCFNSGCGDGFQCNDETGMCEAHNCTGLSTEECGNCGMRTRTCEDGEWSEWGECTGEGECESGSTDTQACGNCGTQTRECSSSCEWGEWGACQKEACWLDSISNLTWQVEPTGGAINHDAAIEHCQGLTLDGGGWRLPTILELRSLIRGCPATETGGSCNIGVDCLGWNCRDNSCNGCSENQGPAGGCYWPEEIEGPAEATTCGRYWSSSPDEDGDRAWRVNFNYGYVNRPSTSNAEFVRCVRIGEMVTVPAGPYWMGCNEAVDDDCMDREYPYHEVNVPEFEIDKYLVTQRLYRACVDAGDCTAPSTHSRYCNWDQTDREDHPANCINWHQSRAYCGWAGKRLCSESEWEKAARGTDGRKYPWGDQTATCDYAVFNEAGEDSENGCGEDRTWPVGSKPPGASPYSALDMAGNVWEWVEDDWHSDYNGAPTDGSAWVDSPRVSYRVVRGGSFKSSSTAYMRASLRYNFELDTSYSNFGIRCCR